MAAVSCRALVVHSVSSFVFLPSSTPLSASRWTACQGGCCSCERECHIHPYTRGVQVCMRASQMGCLLKVECACAAAHGCWQALRATAGFSPGTVLRDGHMCKSSDTAILLHIVASDTPVKPAVHLQQVLLFIIRRLPTPCTPCSHNQTLTSQQHFLQATLSSNCHLQSLL